MAQTVVGFFDNRSDAEDAVVKLVNYGISRDNIDISSGNASGTTSNSSFGSVSGHDDTHDRTEHENGITRFFKNLFGDDDDNAGKYSHVASRADSIITVHARTQDEAERAADILDDAGAVNVDERASQSGYGSGNDRYADTLGSGTGVTGMGSSISDIDNERTGEWNRNNERSEKLDVIREDLDIGKREVERGGVRLRSRIVETPVEETIRLREEHVSVNRTPVDRDISDENFGNFEERDIEMIERAEMPVVNKSTRVVEEVSLDKEVEEREETIRDTVRNTEVDVENLDRTGKTGTAGTGRTGSTGRMGNTTSDDTDLGDRLTGNDSGSDRLRDRDL